MKIILAQGNTGPNYASTRHNIGWLLLDSFASTQNVTFRAQSKFFAETAELLLNGEKTLLVKPTTFYNETGRSARALVDFYKLDPASDVLVLHDDLALPFGAIRTRHSGSDAGNNGIKSLNAHLGGHYWRLRIGIWNELRDRMHDADFVLSRFSEAEQARIAKDIAPYAHRIVADFTAGDIAPHSTTLFE